MQNNPLLPAAPEPPLPLLMLVSTPRAQQIESTNHVLAEALYRISKYIRILDDGHGRRHMLWTGPVRPRTGQPMVHRWLGRKNISAHRALWEAQYGEEPYGRPRRLHECAYELCVSPQCFTTATPREPGALPASMTTGRRVDAEGQPVANYKVSAGLLNGAPFFSSRHRFRPERGFTLQEFTCDDGCECKITVPTCPLGHIRWQWLHDWQDHIGEQYRCHLCSNVMAFIQSLRSHQPRAGFRPMTAASDRLDTEIKEYMASLPHENTPEEALEDARWDAMSDEERFEALMREARKPIGDDEPDD